MTNYETFRPGDRVQAPTMTGDTVFTVSGYTSDGYLLLEGIEDNSYLQQSFVWVRDDDHENAWNSGYLRGYRDAQAKMESRERK